MTDTKAKPANWKCKAKSISTEYKEKVCNYTREADIDVFRKNAWKLDAE